ncbi:MAG: hypothetical protein AAGG50_01280 [Bacteroidota bacterium]
MTFFHDHLTAILIGSTVFFIVTAMTTRLTEAKVDQAGLYQAKAQSLDFATWLEDDLAALAEGADAPARFTLPSRAGGQTVGFEFHRDLVSLTLDTTRVYVRYDLVVTDTKAYADTTVQRYQLVRATREAAMQGGTPAWTTPWQTGGLGPATLTYFDVVPLTRLGQPASDPASTHFLRLAFSLAQPQRGRIGRFRELHWATTLALRDA